MSVFVIAEAGSAWRAGPRDDAADRRRASDLIRVAAAAGCDAVKFQAFALAPVYAEGAGAADYLAARGEARDMNALFRDLALPPDWIPGLAAECADAGIEFMASVFSAADADAVDPFVKRHKIASYELGHAALIRHVARKGKPLVLSTGAATREEVLDAVRSVHIAVGADWPTPGFYPVPDLTVLHCVAAYPAPLGEANLGVLRTLHDSVWPIRALGFSDHTTDPVLAPIAAVALGATMVEKHFTLSRALPGPDHAFALEPPELRQMVEAIRAAESALGDGEKRVMPCEQELRRFATRACQAARDIAAGEVLVMRGPGANLAALRPGNRRRGADARLLSALDGRVARVAIRAGDGVVVEDAERT